MSIAVASPFRPVPVGTFKIMRKPRSPYSVKGNNSPFAALRLALGMTQEEFANYVGISPATLNNCQKDNRLPQSEAAKRVLIALAKKHSIDLPTE